jgi:hypothetical protein
MNNGFMPIKTPRNKKRWEINGFSIQIGFYDSEIIIKDEFGNIMNISKKNRLSLILNLKGSFKSK